MANENIIQQQQKIIINNAGLDNQVQPFRNYGNIAQVNLLNEIDGHFPSVQDELYKGIIEAITETKNAQRPSQNQFNGKTGTIQSQDLPDGTSSLGTPVWGRLVIEPGTYFDSLLGQQSYPQMTFDTVLFTITQTHNVVITPIQGRDNEVIEYIGRLSFRINCKGGIFGKNNNRPKSEIANFKTMINSNQPLIVQSNSFLSEWGISEIVILDKNIPQIAGGYNYQLFEFDAIQNTNVVLAQQQNVS
jgi:hypothetical protein